MVRRYYGTRKKDKTKTTNRFNGNVSGWHVYKDDRGRAVYYDVFSKQDISWQTMKKDINNLVCAL